TPYIDPSVHQRLVEDELSVRRPRRSGRDGTARRIAKRHTPFADPAGLRTPIHRLYVPGRIVGVTVNRGLLCTEGNEPAVGRDARGGYVDHLHQSLRRNPRSMGVAGGSGDQDAQRHGSPEATLSWSVHRSHSQNRFVIDALTNRPMAE